MRLFYSIFLSAICLAIIVSISLSIFKLRPQKSEIESTVKNLEQKLEEIESSSRELSAMMDFFKTDEYKEREARLRLNYKNPGEEAVIVFRNKEDITQGDLEIKAPISNIYKWWLWLWGGN